MGRLGLKVESLSAAVLNRAAVRQALAGVPDAVVCIKPPFGEVYTKDLTEEEILRLAAEWGFIPLNAASFYYNRANLDRLLALWEQGRLVRRDCYAVALQLPADSVDGEDNTGGQAGHRGG